MQVPLCYRGNKYDGVQRMRWGVWGKKLLSSAVVEGSRVNRLLLPFTFPFGSLEAPPRCHGAPVRMSVAPLYALTRESWCLNLLMIPKRWNLWLSLLLWFLPCRLTFFCFEWTVSTTIGLPWNSVEACMFSSGETFHLTGQHLHLLKNKWRARLASADDLLLSHLYF